MLTDRSCKGAKPKEKSYKLFDSGGLFLEIMPSGSKLWRLKYYYLKKEKRISFGPYPIVTLAEAREKQMEAKKMLQNNADPSKARKDTAHKEIRKVQNTFKFIAHEWHEIQSETWSDRHAKNVMHKLETDIFPFIGKRPITEIDVPDLLDVLRKIEKRGALDVAARARQICGQIFRHAIQTGRCKENPAIHLQGALKTKKTEHFAAIRIEELPEFLQTLDRNEARLFARTRRAIQLSLLTFLRPGEIRKARWDDIDFESKLWTIPGELMKMGRDHIVPLSDQAIEVLKEQQIETGHFKTNWVFPSLIKPKNPISDGTVNVAIKRMGYQGRMTAHGFRALARTAIREKLRYDSEVIERQLAHKPSGTLGAAYDRTEFLEERQEMMQDWADYIDSICSNQVIEGHFKKAG